MLIDLRSIFISLPVLNNSQAQTVTDTITFCVQIFEVENKF